MHIPDGYLSPQTCAVAYAAAVPTWVVASRRVTKVVKTRNVPLLAMFCPP
jgi:cobalt/nickel transport system permease protein